MLYRDLVRALRPAATLYTATEGQPARSARYREFLAPQGYDDELRAAFRLGASTWGMLDLFRERGRPPFSPRDLDVVLSVGPVIAAALRALALSTALPTATPKTPPRACCGCDRSPTLPPGPSHSIYRTPNHWCRARRACCATAMTSSCRICAAS